MPAAAAGVPIEGSNIVPANTILALGYWPIH
jgi:hypothetical protein